MSWLNQIFRDNHKLKLLQLLPEEEKSSWGGEYKIPEFKPMGLAPGLTEGMMSPGNVIGELKINDSQINNGAPVKLNFDVTYGLYTPDSFKVNSPTPNLSTTINGGKPILDLAVTNYVNQTNDKFNKRYDWNLKDTSLLELKTQYANMDKSGVRDWLRSKGINPYSLSGSLRKQLRLMFLNGDLHKFETDLLTLYGDNMPTGDKLSNYLQARLNGNSDVFNAAQAKFNELAALNFKPTLPTEKELTPEEDFMNYIKDSLSGCSLNADGKTYSDLRITDFQNWYNGSPYADKTLTVDGKFGNATMSALRTVARNFNKTNPDEWIESLFGKQLFGLNKSGSTNAGSTNAGLWGDLYKFLKGTEYNKEANSYIDHGRGYTWYGNNRVFNRNNNMKGSWTYNATSGKYDIKWDPFKLNLQLNGGAPEF